MSPLVSSWIIGSTLSYDYIYPDKRQIFKQLPYIHRAQISLHVNIFWILILQCFPRLDKSMAPKMVDVILWIFGLWDLCLQNLRAFQREVDLQRSCVWRADGLSETCHGATLYSFIECLFMVSIFIWYMGNQL